MEDTLKIKFLDLNKSFYFDGETGRVLMSCIYLPEILYILGEGTKSSRRWFILYSYISRHCNLPRMYNGNLRILYEGNTFLINFNNQTIVRDRKELN